MDGITEFTKTDSRGRELFYAGNNPLFWIAENNSTMNITNLLP